MSIGCDTNKPERGREYVICCIRCGCMTDLGMVAHRNEQGKMVGWIFACKTCFDFVTDGNISFVEPKSK